MPNTPKAVAFDVFGTLCYGHDSYGPYLRIRDTLRYPKDQFRIMAMTQDLSLPELVEKICRGNMNDDLKNKVADIALELADDCQRVTLFDDVIPTLTQLRNGGIPYGLISNLATPYVEPVIKLLSAAELLPPPELCLWSCKEGVIKPDKVIFERFCERVKMSPSEVLVIGDNQRNDLFGARDVGCQARILLRGNRTKDESMSAEDCISGLDSVPRLLGLELAPQLEFRRNSRGQNLSP